MMLNKLQRDVSALFEPGHTARLPLAATFRSEKCMRDELRDYLCSLGWNAESEVPFVKNGIRRNLDIVVNDGTQDRNPLCMIELTYSSAGRGSTWSLTAGMNLDFFAARPPVPMMHLGVYKVPAVDEEQPPSQFTSPLRSYVMDDSMINAEMFKRRMQTWSRTQQWRADATIGAERFAPGKALDGYLGYFVGIRQATIPPGAGRR